MNENHDEQGRFASGDSSSAEHIESLRKTWSKMKLSGKHSNEDVLKAHGEYFKAKYGREPVRQEPTKQEPTKQEPTKQEPTKQEPITGERFTDEHAWVKSLTEDQQKAITSWSRNGYKFIRQYEKTGHDVDGTYAAKAAALNEALKTAPVYEGAVARGLGKLSISQAAELSKVGSTIKLEAASSFATNTGAAKQFAYEGTSKSERFVVMRVAKNESAVKIRMASTRQNEAEAISPKGTSYRVVGSTKVTTAHGLTGYEVHLEEINNG
jgi:hypothetical protein